jgi:transcriptional regulator with XRE-family HTH domain
VPKLRTLTPGASPMHHFGAEVRRARETAGMTQSELGELVPCDKATVSRIEAGLTAPDAHFAAVCDTAFPQAGGWFSRFWADSQTWESTFPAQFRAFAEYEAEATSLWLFEHSLIPGLLQTEAYAHAVLSRHPHVTDAEITERVAARMARQAVLDRDDPPLVWTLLDENVLHREVGNAKIMGAALEHLAMLAARPKVTVQLLPGKDVHAGLQGAMAMAETPDACVVNLEDFADGRTTDSPIIVAQVNERFDTLRSDAYRRSDSLRMIQEAAERWTA